MTTTTRTISIAATLLGVLVLAALVASAFSPLGRGIFGSSGASGEHTASPAGITSVEVASHDAQVTVAFADVDEAHLEASGSDSWRMSTSGDTLKVTNDRLFGGLCFMWCDSGREQVTLTLPAELEGRLSAGLELASGSMNALGDFADLGVEISAGSFTYAGRTPDVDVEISAGSADLTVEDARDVHLEVNAGDLTTTLRGEAPDSVRADVAAGDLDLTVPDTSYRVSTEVVLGSIDNQLRTSADSPHTVDVQVAAGRVALRPGPESRPQDRP